MSKKIGIDEAMDVMNFLHEMAKDIAEAKKDDGKISASEVMKAVMTNSPNAVRAFVGYENIDEELNDLSKEEKEKLLFKAIEVLQAFAKTFD